MTALPSIVFGLMLLSIFLLGILTLRLADARAAAAELD